MKKIYLLFLLFAFSGFAQNNNPFAIPVCALLSVLEGVKILKLSLGLLLVCVAIFRVPAGAYGSLRASPFFDSSTFTKTSHARPPLAQAVLGLVISWT